MPMKYQRYALKSKQAKLLLNEVSRRLKISLDFLFNSKARVEVVRTDIGKIYLVNSKPLLFKATEKILPTLIFQDFALQAPRIIVDLGAVPYVCNGADIMAPGIVRIEGKFGKGDLVLVVDEKYGKPIALGESLYNSENAKNTKQGVVVNNLHFVSDKIWNIVKALNK